MIGMRAKLATRHGGHWGTTSGENAKFGLSPSNMVAVMRKLTALGMADSLQLLHFHIGSQVRMEIVQLASPSCMMTRLQTSRHRTRHFKPRRRLLLQYKASHGTEPELHADNMLECGD